MSERFNYKRAHKEWSLPQFKALPDDIKALYGRIQKECADTFNRGGCNGSLEKDCPPDIWAVFLRLAAERPLELSRAEVIVDSLGRWDDKTEPEVGWHRDAHGGYFKFGGCACEALIVRAENELRYKARLEEKAVIETYKEHVEGTPYTAVELTKILRRHIKPEFADVWITNVDHKPDQFALGKDIFDTSVKNEDHRCACCGKRYAEHTHVKLAVLRFARSIPPDKTRDVMLTEDEKNKVKLLAKILKPLGATKFAFRR